MSRLPFNLNWISLLLLFIFFPQKFFLSPVLPLCIHEHAIKTLHGEFISSMGKIKTPGISLVLIRFFLFIVYSNFLGLFPYIFTSTSHLVITIRLVLPVWLGYMILSIVNRTNFFLSHLVPTGTPYVLMPFMVIIELIRRIIRPLTLSVRLAANMIAGHILMSLVRSPMASLGGLVFLSTFFGLLILIVLELAVSVIQSYVFRTLLSLYIIEVNSPNF